MLLGCTEFTKVYPHIKDNPWPYVNLVNLTQNSGMSGDEIAELLNISRWHLPRVRLEYDRLEAELNSLKADVSNSVQVYQDFCDRNIELKKRENELFNTINELEAKKADLQRIRLNGSLSQSEFQDNDTNNTNVILKARLEEIISTNDVLMQLSNISTNF